MQFSKRLEFLQTNVFADMDRAKARAMAAGRDLIDLSLGSSDLPADLHVIEAIADSLYDPSTHGYLLFHGTRAFRQAAASWYTQKFGIAVDPETEVLPLIGSQEGTAHLPLAVLNPGEFALLLDPGYPSHAGGVYLASGQIYPMPLRAENGFLPELEEIPLPVLAQSRMMVLSYPHNPTAAIAPFSFSKQLLPFVNSIIWCWFTTSPMSIWCLTMPLPLRFCKPTQKKVSRLSSSPFPSPTTWEASALATPLGMPC